MAETMIERVARAIYERCNHWDYDGHLPDYDTLEEGGKAQWQEAARAAIEAMKLPTPEMEEAGFQAGHEGDGEWEYASPLATYTAMIDAALPSPAIDDMDRK